jgi:energy-coupling factor transporter ATP-binding protein EcfA2
MSFTVVPPHGWQRSTFETPFVLRRDNWNDYWFHTTYELYQVENSRVGDLVGQVKILRKGQREKEPHQLQDGFLMQLDDTFCSLGQSLDYYERLATLDPTLRQMVLDGLRDAVDHADIAKAFKEERGWSVSLLRSINEDEFFELSRVIVTRNYSALPRLSLDLTFELQNWSSPVNFRFDAPDVVPFGGSGEILPQRIAVIVGANGSGKSTLLARLARVAHASPRERDALRPLGHLVPEGIGFTRIVAITFSAFDSFEVPGINSAERRQIADDVERGTGRYIFCGLRDIVRELREDTEAEGDTDNSAADSDQPLRTERRAQTLLKPIEQMAAEFARTVNLIRRTGRQELLEESLGPLLQDPSFGELSDEFRTAAQLLGDDPASAYLAWSTGHKIVLHVVLSLVAYIERKSLVLFDEPEAHLHPPLLAALMHSIRIVLRRQDSFAVVATHSPVVLQETLSRQVHMARREGATFSVFPAAIQTFGENIGTLTREVFALTTDVTDYHAVLRRLREAYQTIDEIESLFDGELSMQARAFLMSLFAEREP